MMATNPHQATNIQQMSSMRVLVAFEDVRAVYRDIFARAIRELRPALSVRSASVGVLEHELLRFDPHVVVSSRPSEVGAAGCSAWVHVPTEDGLGEDERLARICLDGERWRTDGPPLIELLKVLDETEDRLRQGNLSGAC